MPDIEIVKFKSRRGTDSQRQLVVLEQGELGYTTDTKRLFLGDGATLGGNSATTRAHTINATLGSTLGLIGDTLYKDGKLLQLSAVDYNQASNWAYIGPKCDNITIALSSWGSQYNLALIQSGVLVLSGLTNTGNGITVNVDNSTIQIDGNNSIYVPANGITSNELSNNAVVSNKISTDALATQGGINLTSGKLTLNPINGLSVDVSNNLTINYDSTLAVNALNQLYVATEGGVRQLSQGIGLSGANTFIHTNNKVYGCGLQVLGNFGTGPSSANIYLPRAACFTSNYNNIATVYSHLYNSYVVDLSGFVYSTGLNDNYQSGVNAVSATMFTQLVLSGTSAPLSAVRVLTTTTGVSSNLYSVYAVTSANKLYAWGNNAAGQLGNYNTTAVQQPTLIPSLSSVDVQSVKAVGAGDGATSYALTPDGLVYVTGDNTSGQLGINYGTSVDLTSYTLLSTVTNVAAIYVVGEAKNNSIWFVSTNGQVSAAGFNNALSPLGCPQLGNVTVVANVSALSGGARAVSKIVGHTNGELRTMFALTSANELFGWGSNTNGQLGLGDLVTYKEPTFITTNVYDVVIGGSGSNTTTAVLLSDGLYTAGYNEYGVCGTGTNTLNYPNFTKVLLPNNIGRGDIKQFKMNNVGMQSETGQSAHTLQILLTSGKLLTCGYDSARFSVLGVDAVPQSIYYPSEIKL